MGRGGEAGGAVYFVLSGAGVAWSIGTGIVGFYLVSPLRRPHLDAEHHDMTMGGPGPGCPQLVQCVCNIGLDIKVTRLELTRAN